MKLRFTIRDLLWLTVVIAMAIGWWLDHRKLTTESQIFLDPEPPAAAK